MVDQLNSFASEVTRVAREVGTEGKLGGQAIVRGVGGTWKDLTDSPSTALDRRLAAALALGADLARDARHLGREVAELVHHLVDRFCGAQELAS